MSDDGLLDSHVGPLVNVQRVGERIHDEIWTVELGKLDPPDAVPEMASERVSGAERKTTLADATGPGQRDRMR